MKQFGRYIIDHGHTLVVLLPVSTLENTFNQKDTFETVNVAELPDSSLVSLHEDLPTSAQKDATSSKLSVIYETTHNIWAV